METQRAVGGAPDLSVLETFLRGMETRAQAQSSIIEIPLETFLRGMETPVHRVLQLGVEALKPSLEGWKP